MTWLTRTKIPPKYSHFSDADIIDLLTEDGDEYIISPQLYGERVGVIEQTIFPIQTVVDVQDQRVVYSEALVYGTRPNLTCKSLAMVSSHVPNFTGISLYDKV